MATEPRINGTGTEKIEFLRKFLEDHWNPHPMAEASETPGFHGIQFDFGGTQVILSSSGSWWIEQE